MNYNDLKAHTLLCPERFNKLRHLCNLTKDVEGAMAEVGVYKGGSSYWLCQNSPNKKMYCMDTFGGMPETDKSIDAHNKGDFTVSLESVQKLMEPFKDRTTFVKGIFPRENAEILENEKFSLVHLDVDIYSSEIECIDFFWDRISPGGILVFDDFFCPSTVGATKAILEKFNIKDIINSAMFQCYVVKK
jgi:predicted O-methyltransferase YrrM